MTKEKHLELIQKIINRMAQNSLTYKWWMLSIFIIKIAFSFNAEMPEIIKYICIIPILGFWGFDAYYLRQERLFRALYNHVRTLSKIDFSMDTSAFSKKVTSWPITLFSKTVFWLYFPAFILILIINQVR